MDKMNEKLRGLRAFVCGSTQGIGRACALGLAKKGASVVLIARNPESLDRVLRELSTDAGQSHDTLCADFTYPDQLELQVSHHLASQPMIHILVNNTGGPPSGPITGATEKDFAKAFTQHVVCNQLLAKALLPGMRQAGYGRIINIISTSVKQPIPGLGVSNTIRAAVANWAKTWSLEVARFGITVNNVLPGYTDTQRLKELFEATALRTSQSADAIKQESLKSIPSGRLATPEDIAEAVCFLASPAAGYINGVNLPVDGGRTGCL